MKHFLNLAISTLSQYLYLNEASVSFSSQENLGCFQSNICKDKCFHDAGKYISRKSINFPNENTHLNIQCFVILHTKCNTLHDISLWKDYQFCRLNMHLFQRKFKWMYAFFKGNISLKVTALFVLMPNLSETLWVA